MNDYSQPERAGSIHNVPGRFFPAHAWDADRWSTQTWKSEARALPGDSHGAQLCVEARFDDNCKNGHNTFAITADMTELRHGRRVWSAGGCMHDEIAKAFPELAALIKWHLTSSDGPMHYIGNTVYHAGDIDHNGLRAGERRQIRNGKSRALCWELAYVDADGNTVRAPEKYIDSDTRPECAVGVAYVPWERVGEGKERQLEFARSSAVWPEATDAELSVPANELRAALEARHPALLVAFRAAIVGSGLKWSPTELGA